MQLPDARTHEVQLDQFRQPVKRRAAHVPYRRVRYVQIREPGEMFERLVFQHDRRRVTAAEPYVEDFLRPRGRHLIRQIRTVGHSYSIVVGETVARTGTRRCCGGRRARNEQHAQNRKRLHGSRRDHECISSC